MTFRQITEDFWINDSWQFLTKRSLHKITPDFQLLNTELFTEYLESRNFSADITITYLPRKIDQN